VTASYGEFSDFRPTSDFVRAFLPEAPSRLLEIGCGSGELALALQQNGYDITAIDPAAPEGPPFSKTTLEAFTGSAPFARVVAMRALHHIPDLDGAITKIAALMGPGGAFILEDFGWERMDDPTLAWFFERMRALGRGPRDGPVPASLEECRQSWTREHADLHTSKAMFAALGARFSTRMFAWTHYLNHLLKDPEGKDGEIEALISERISPIAFRFVGFPKM